jgi:peptidase M28-like protein
VAIEIGAVGTGIHPVMKGTNMPSVKTARNALVAVLAAAAGLAFTSIPAQAAPVAAADLPDGPALARNLARKVTISGINRHLIAFQRFADRTGGGRAAGTEGHRQSAEYVATKLENIGFIVTRQEFTFTDPQTSATTTTYNVLAETQTGRHDNVVLAGAHLDSAAGSPGINGDGSGSATLLETALQLGGAPRVNNAVRFGFWSAGAANSAGSTAYVQSLDFEEQLNIALYLNFDTIASPNGGRFVFDGDNSDGGAAGPGPFGSAQIEAAFTDFLGATEVPTEGTPLNGGSDYREFVAQGIPAGGLFSGTGGTKTDAQVDKWGGVSGAAFDACAGKACDNLGNVDRAALDSNADAAAWVIATYGISTEDINGIPPGAAAAKLAASKKANAKSRLLATMTARAASPGTREGSAR